MSPKMGSSVGGGGSCVCIFKTFWSPFMNKKRNPQRERMDGDSLYLTQRNTPPLVTGLAMERKPLHLDWKTPRKAGHLPQMGLYAQQSQLRRTEQFVGYS